MKKKHVSYIFIIVFFLLSISNYAQSNTITLNALPGGTEGTSTYTDTSILSISASGVVSYNNSNTFDDWGVTSSMITHSGVLNKTFGVTIGGMASVDVSEGKNYGKKILDGGIDRASDGALGIRGGFGNGIDINEGINFGLDLTNLSSSAAIQITKIYVTLSGSSNESGVIVSRLNPSKRIIFGNSATPGVTYPITNGVEAIDISSFNVYLQGGIVNKDMIAILNNSAIVNNIRITGLELNVLSNNLDTSSLTNMAHPRLLLKAGEEALIQSLINTSPEHNKSHTYIIETANTFLQAPPIVKPSGTRILSESQAAIEQIFFLAYAYRMTGETQYLTKAETVINDVCNWDNWITYSLDTSEMTFAVAIGYDWLFNDLTAATKQKAREKILNYGFLTQKNSAFWNYTSNWNQVCIGALSCAALAIYGDGTTQMNTEAAFVLNNILVKNPNSMNTYGNGNYPEGPMYWSYGTTYEVLMLSALEGVYGKNHEGINRLIATPGFLESAEYMQYATGPTSLYFNYSDSTSKRIPLPATLWMAEKANKPSWVSEEKKLMENGSYVDNFENRRFLPLALIYGKDISLDNLPDPQAKLWKGYGVNPLALVRTEWKGSLGKYMGIKGGTPTYSHGQMDGGFFIYDSQGIRWGMDFGKYDYDAQGTIDDNDFSQSSQRWDIFRVSNLSQNTISIKKATETTWQKHKVDGDATIDEVYDTSAKRGAKVNMKSLLGLNNELLAANRSAYLVDESYFEVKDYISNGAEPINLYWNMVTKSQVETISPSTIRLTQGGKTVLLEIVSSNPAVTFTLATNRSTDPVFYNPTATADSKNPGTVMLGFEATIPANNDVTFTVTIKDDAVVPPTSVEPINSIVLDLPNPTTGMEGNSLYYDTSELHIDANGDASIGGQSLTYAWRVNGGTNINNADNSKFFFRWKAMATTDTTQGVNYGALLTPAGMDRASTGELGVRGGAGAGIDPNEGFNLGFDLSYLPNTVQLQLVKVGVSEVNGTENGVIVNRKDTSKRTTFGGSSSTASVKFSTGKGDINVENLGITLTGGEINYDLASLFNPTTSGSFRMDKFVFKLLIPSYLITASTTGNGSVTGAGTYQAGTTTTLIATPPTGYSFFNWTEGGAEVSTNASYLFTVNSSRILVANFVPLISVTSCNSYIWNGIEYTTTGVYTGTTVNGQTQKLDLTIIPATTIGSESVSVCGNAYTWPTSGATYITSGTYTYVEGCNTATLNLTINPLTTEGSVTTSINAGESYTWPANGQTYTTAQNGTTFVSGCNTATLNLTVITTQIPSGPLSLCKGATVASVTGTTSLKFYAASTGGTALEGTTAFATKIYYVTEIVSGVESTPRTALLVTVHNLPATPSALVSNPLGESKLICKYIGSSIPVTFDATAAGGVISYVWSVPSGATIASGDGTSSIGVIFLGASTTAGVIGSVVVRSKDANNCLSLPKSLILTTVLPTAPASITMTSTDSTPHFDAKDALTGIVGTVGLNTLAKITKVGPYMGTEKVFTFTSPEAPTAASYKWTLPMGVNAIASSTVSISLLGVVTSTTPVITANFAGVGTGIESLPVSIQSVGGCGSSALKTLTLTRAVPGAPKALTLTNTTLPNLSALTKITKVGPYTQTEIPFILTATPLQVQGATSTSYAWILPAGVNCITANTPTTVRHKVNVGTTEAPVFETQTVAALSTATNEIIVNFSGTTGTGNLDLLVFGVNGAGNSIAKKLVLARATPTAPSALVLKDGNTIVTKAGSYTAKETPLTLRATPITIQGAEATSYSWVLPAGVNVTAGASLSIDNGTTKTWTGTESVLAINLAGIGIGVTSIPMHVYAVNGAGTSTTARTLTLTIAAPATPGSITTPALGVPTFNPTCNSGIITVQVPNVYGVDYTWTLGSGATITSGQGTNSIVVNVENVTTTTLSIGVVGSNGTGNSVLKVLVIKKVSTCRTAVESIVDEFSVIAYPNPSASEFTIESSSKGATTVQVYDMMGRLIENAQANANSVQVGRNYAAGTYNVVVSQGAKAKTLKVIKK